EEFIARAGVHRQSRLSRRLYLQAAVFHTNIQCKVWREPVASRVARELFGLERDLLRELHLLLRHERRESDGSHIATDVAQDDHPARAIARETGEGRVTARHSVVPDDRLPSARLDLPCESNGGILPISLATRSRHGRQRFR